MTGRPDAFQLAAGSSVVGVGVDLFPFQKFVRIDAAAEFFRGEEVILLAVRFAFARGAGSGRDRKFGIQDAFGQQAVDDRGLSRTGWGGKDEYLAGTWVHPYSTLSDCSLIFSSSSFIRTTSFCMSAWLDLDPIVLISRPISWAMKPSFFPQFSSLSIVLRK